jgi:amidohydrolase/hippurate hydrolase
MMALPALINSKRNRPCRKAAARVAGEQQVMTNLPLLMGSEDFAFMLQRRPGAYIGLGAGDARPNGFLHQPSYVFNAELLPVGAAYWVSLAEGFLSGAPGGRA